MAGSKRLHQPSPRFMRKFALVRMSFWAILMPVTAYFHHFKMDVSLAIMEVSLYANFATDLTNFTAAEVEVRQDEQGVEIATHGAAEVDVELEAPPTS